MFMDESARISPRTCGTFLSRVEGRFFLPRGGMWPDLAPVFHVARCSPQLEAGPCPQALPSPLGVEGSAVACSQGSASLATMTSWSITVPHLSSLLPLCMGNTSEIKQISMNILTEWREVRNLTPKP